MQKPEIAIWGTGNIAKKFYYENGFRFDIKYFIDNYEPKNCLKHLKIYNPNQIELKRYKIIIAIAEWKSVSKQLKEQGLVFYKDYIPYDWLEKDEIPYMDIMTEIIEKADEEDIVQYYQNGRKIAFINGNCQVSRIKQYLKQNKMFSDNYVFLDIPAIHILQQNEVEMLMRHKEIFKKIELFITQNISFHNAFDYRLSNEYLIHLMSKNVQYVRIPNLFFDVYFPQGGKEQDVMKDSYVRYMFPYNDAIIDELSEKKGFTGGGYTVDEITQIINLEELFTPNFLEWVVEYRMKQLKERESKCDIKMMDYIEEHYLNEQLFYSRNHPTNRVLKEESIRILHHINSKWNETIEHEEDIGPLSVWEEFIYPSVLNGMRLNFTKSKYSDGVSKCKCTMNDEIRKYLFCHS